nr:hypothetical protein [Hyphomonas sp. Mor2]
MRVFLFFFIAALFPMSAHAYIGPGAGLGALAFLVGMIIVVLLLFIGFIWYPLKRYLKRRK